jgi:hypothetical protein
VNALDSKLKQAHDKAYKKREQQGFSYDKASPDEWLYHFWRDLFMSLEERYQHLKANYGFGHEGIDGGVESSECKPSCRYYKPTGRIEARELLELEYSKFDGFKEVLKAWDLAQHLIT